MHGVYGKSGMWLVIGLMLLQSLLPAFAHAASASKSAWLEVCSVYGPKKVRADNFQDSARDTDQQCRVGMLAQQPTLIHFSTQWEIGEAHESHKKRPWIAGAF